MSAQLPAVLASRQQSLSFHDGVHLEESLEFAVFFFPNKIHVSENGEGV